MENKTQPQNMKSVSKRDEYKSLSSAICDAESTIVQSTMEKLSRHSSEAVRSALLRNISIPNTILCNMCENDKSEKIRDKAKAMLIKRSKRM